MWLDIWDRIVEDSGLNEERIPGVQIVKATSSTGSRWRGAKANFWLTMSLAEFGTLSMNKVVTWTWRCSASFWCS